MEEEDRKGMEELEQERALQEAMEWKERRKERKSKHPNGLRGKVMHR